MALGSRTPQSFADAIRKLMSVSYDTRIWLRRNYDDWMLKQMWHNFKTKAKVRTQAIDIVAHQKLGSDLAVSRFVLSKCRREIRDQRGVCIRRMKDLPQSYDKSFKVTAIEAPNCGLLTEGVDNFVGLEYCEYLDLSHNQNLDEFSCDQLARQFRNSTRLVEINLSHNPFISVHALEILMRIPSLRRIVAIDTLASDYEDIDLFVLAAEEEHSCDIMVHANGRKYKLQSLEDLSVQREKVESGN